MKRIAIFCDGTWNSPDETDDGSPAPTNVVKLARAVAQRGSDGTEQVLYYDQGIGSAGAKPRRIFEGLTGTGISANILQAYSFLIQHFEVDDQLFLFGFSRGAFTVRSLAGLIRNVGILRPTSADRIADAFAMYRSRDLSSRPREIGPELFRRTHAHQNITPIHFIGVWDKLVHWAIR
jgi:uncharacterized protein (DUF2235 family)